MEGIIHSIFKNAVRIKAKDDVKANDNHLLEQIKDLTLRMGVIRCCFDFETNSDMIDSYILELDALEKRYSYLIKQAKQTGIVAF